MAVAQLKQIKDVMSGLLPPDVLIEMSVIETMMTTNKSVPISNSTTTNEISNADKLSTEQK